MYFIIIQSASLVLVCKSSLDIRTDLRQCLSPCAHRPDWVCANVAVEVTWEDQRRRLNGSLPDGGPQPHPTLTGWSHWRVCISWLKCPWAVNKSHTWAWTFVGSYISIHNNAMPMMYWSASNQNETLNPQQHNKPPAACAQIHLRRFKVKISFEVILELVVPSSWAFAPHSILLLFYSTVSRVVCLLLVIFYICLAAVSPKSDLENMQWLKTLGWRCVQGTEECFLVRLQVALPCSLFLLHVSLQCSTQPVFKALWVLICCVSIGMLCFVF